MELFDLSTDLDAINEGVWVDKVKNGGDAEFLVLGFLSKRIKALSIELEASRPDKFDTDLKLQGDRNEYEARQKLKAGLLGFRNMTLRGQPWAFDAAAVAEKLDDPKFYKFALVVNAAMNKADETRIAYEADAEKNSQSGSAES